MINRHKIWFIFILILSMVFVSSCATTKPLSGNSTEDANTAREHLPEKTHASSSMPDTPSPIPTSSTLHATCGWRAIAYTWVDANQDSKKDPNEEPLAGVSFIITNTVNGFVRRGGTTDSLGTHNFFVLLGGCPEASFLVSPEIPTGYRLTTPATIRSNYPKPDNEPFEFGFAKAE